MTHFKKENKKDKKSLIKKFILIGILREKMANNSVKLMRGFAEKNGLDLDAVRIYDATYGEYITDFCNTIHTVYQKVPRKIGEEEALEIMNKDLIRQLQGNFILKSKDYCVNNAIELFRDVSLYIKSRIANKYGFSSSKELEDTQAIRGMIAKVSHLVKVENI